MKRKEDSVSLSYIREVGNYCLSLSNRSKQDSIQNLKYNYTILTHIANYLSIGNIIFLSILT